MCFPALSVRQILMFIIQRIWDYNSWLCRSGIQVLLDHLGCCSWLRHLCVQWSWGAGPAWKGSREGNGIPTQLSASRDTGKLKDLPKSSKLDFLGPELMSVLQGWAAAIRSSTLPKQFLYLLPQRAGETFLPSTPMCFIFLGWGVWKVRRSEEGQLSICISPWWRD